MDSAKHWFTLVQHSGFVGGGNPQFQRAVEGMSVSGKKVMEAIRSRGGVLLPTYTGISDRELKENYPPEVTGLIPRVRGKFARYKVHGQRLYIPTDKTDG